MDHCAKGLSPNVILAMMALASVAIARALLPIEGPPDSDFALFLYPWMDAIRHQGLASVAGSFSEYTPPYIYLLNLAALIEPSVGTIAAIKLINVPFVVSCAWGIGAIVRQVTGDKDRGTIAAAVTLICPTLLINSFAHGQCDAIFTGFLIWFIYFAVRERPIVACLMFGIAISFKQQAIFVAPLLLTLVLWRRMKLWHLLIIPATYVVMMVPAAIAGRSWNELLLVYAGQTNLKHDLSVNAPNFWWFLRGHGWYPIGVKIGLALGAITGVLIVARSTRLKRDAMSILLVATVCAALMPAILPKMTSRYFFVADLLTIALAFSQPRLWPAAVLIQIGSLVAVSSYFFGELSTAPLAFGPTTLGVGILVYELFAVESASPADPKRSVNA
jgi:Gpi18-like mannosyltransferase